MKHLIINSRQAETSLRCLNKHLPEDDKYITDDEFDIMVELASIVEKQDIMEAKEKVKQLLDECKVYTDIPKKPLGGQQAGMPIHPVVVEHENLGVKISIKHFRANYKNREKALMIMELFLLDLIN